ncbi:ATP-binding protein [Gorillibacterium sp. sgz5001074]|uniref:ATP-binding protein n=1 Tax=Gorillibacterium sp. sgz5001074 TaxID=3446695 RepID=UPI003F66E906
MNLKRKRGLASGISYWTTLMIALASLLVILLGTIVNVQNRDIGSAIEIQFREQVQVQELDRLSRTIVSSYRGYIAYGRPEFLDTLFTNIEELLAGISKVRSSMAERGGDVRQTDEMAYIESVWHDLGGQMEKGVLYKQNNDIHAYELLSQTQITPSIDGANKRFNNLLALQESRVQDLVRRNKDMSYWLLLVPTGMILLTGLVGYYLVHYVRKTVVTPIEYMSGAVSRIAGGDYTDPVGRTDRPDELGDLQRGIHLMTEELKKRQEVLESFNRELITQRDQLEAQNEEIIAQQEEQSETLEKLTSRERELEVLSSYQEKLTGFMDLQQFLGTSVPLLLQVLGADGAAVVLGRQAGEGTGTVVYATGYPAGHLEPGSVELYGPSARIFSEKRTITRLRGLTRHEASGLPLYDRALDLYVPLLDTDQNVYGFLLLTTFGGQSLSEESVRPHKGIIAQFGMALQAQVLHEDRQKQSGRLRELNDELIHEKLLLQEQRDLIRQINEAIHEGMLMLDADGNVIFANRRMNSFFGYIQEKSHTLDDFCECLARTACSEAGSLLLKVKGILEGAADAIHERFMVDGPEGRRYFELYVNAVEGTIFAGGGFLMVFRDRTEEEKVDEMKNEFVSIVSHELRTPLSSVLGFIEILLHRSVPEDKQKRYLETIHSEANRLSNLINDFLDLQRMESGKQLYQPVPVPLLELVDMVAGQWQGKNGHTIRIRAEDGPLMVLGDRDRITQVLHNLISNAVKYSPGAEAVDILASREDGYIRIDVKDYGLGIPEDAKPMLFSKFYRVDNTDRRQIGGTGLGLAIVKEIVEAHGGRLSFESVLGDGSVFTVFLPAYQHKDLSGKVVIVEDDANLASMISVSFDKLSLPTVILSSAEDASYSLQQSASEPLLCIVDIQLSGVRSGWDFIADLLKHPEHRNTPVIVSTVLEQPNHFYETDKGRYLKKPFTIGRLLELAQHLISERQSAASFLFPVQNERVLSESLQHNGITVKQMKVNSDFIEVDIEKDERGTGTSNRA